MKIRTFLLGCFLLFASAMVAQQESQYSAFMYNKLYYNPATAGSRGVGSFAALYRQQWVGFKGAPISQMVSFSTPLISDAIGFGLQLNHASKGITDNIFASMAYNYKLKLSEKNSLRLGIQGSMRRWALNFRNDRVRLSTVDDSSIELANTYSKWEGNVGAGLYLQLGDYFEGGVSVPNAYNSKLSVDDSKSTDGARVVQHFYTMLAGNIDISNRWTFKPSALVKIVKSAPVDFDLNLGMVYNSKIMGAVGYRTGGDNKGESINTMVFYQLGDKFGFGANYDIGLSKIASQAGGSFEIMARFDLKTKREDLVNPRFF